MRAASSPASSMVFSARMVTSATSGFRPAASSASRTASKSPGAVYLELRMARARHLVVTTDMAMIAVAAEVGFVDAAHFGRRFREHFGRTPMQMRLAARAETAGA